MQGIKIILSFVALVSVFIGSTSTVGTKDVENTIEKTINTIMIGAIEGTPYDMLDVDIAVSNQEFVDWYHSAIDQWHIDSSDNESYTFNSNIEEIQRVNQDKDKITLEIHFTYDYERIIYDENGNKHKYAIGSSEMGIFSVQIAVNYKRIEIHIINPIYFTIK